MSKKNERHKAIMEIAKKNKKISVGDILHITTNRIQAYRDIQKLIAEKKLIAKKKGIYAYLPDPIEYFQIPFYERDHVSYNPEFLRSYTPNQTQFLSIQQQNAIQKSLNSTYSLDTNYYKNNKRILEKALIDLSFSSSLLEGNTYSYLNTEVLIKYTEITEEKAKEETTMILNHKKCIEYMIYGKHNLTRNKKTFCEIQSLLSKELIPSTQVGIFRNSPVDIGGSKYTPLPNQIELESEFDLFIEKLSLIKNPREQSVFILTFVPYFQVFIDINKRTSRMSANIPLIQNNLPLISFMGIKKEAYITAILAIYELNNPSLLAELYTQNYIKRAKRYSE